MNFKYSKCPKCGLTGALVFNNNPIIGESVCFECASSNLNYLNIEHAEFFCRTYNLSWNPNLWLALAEQDGVQVFKTYAEAVLSDRANFPNLAYESSTKDLWARTNKEWEKVHSFNEILGKLDPIKQSYLDRGHLKWGEQYTFEELVKLDSIYIKTLKANNITNPIQKEAVKTLCKLQIETDTAIRSRDAKAIKDFSSAWSTFAKQADLETMINETKTQDITTVAELYDYMERQGFVFKYFDGADKDEVDRAIKDIQESNRRLILEATGLQPLLEDMIKKQQEQNEHNYMTEVAEKQSLADMLDLQLEEDDIAVEDDDEVLGLAFEDQEK